MYSSKIFENTCRSIRAVRDRICGLRRLAAGVEWSGGKDVLGPHVHPQFLIASAFVAWMGGVFEDKMCTVVHILGCTCAVVQILVGGGWVGGQHDVQGGDTVQQCL